MNVEKACIIGCIMAVSLVNSLHARAQISSSLDDDRPRVIEKKPVPPKTSFVFKSSEFYLAGATAFDMKTTVDFLGHPTIASKPDGEILMYLRPVENGFPGRYLGKTDAFMAVSSNVFLNAGVERFSRRLYARGGRWRTVAFGLNVAKATINTVAAVHNIRSDAGLNNHIKLLTGYNGQIIWSH